ncbi:clusterin-associated protein 1 [Nilaparvata lugens]|uniref:clusterin-associated protein 1 n=1 Tax=Nilaparvata lugens TaxID=108931 RepID=UPI00193E8298|nr:clusterin-associated protein 1 [Nilaparvata lugens]
MSIVLYWTITALLSTCVSVLSGDAEKCTPAMQDLTLMMSWKNIQWSENQAVNHSVNAYSEPYDESAIIPVRMQMWRTQAFLTFPRYRPGIPFSLGYVLLTSSNRFDTEIYPFPSWLEHTKDTYASIVNAVDIYLDHRNLMLWVLDTGEINTLVKPQKIAPPRIFGIHITNRKVAKVIDLSDMVCPESRLQFIVADATAGESTNLFVSDAGTRSLLVYNGAMTSDSRGFRVQLPPLLCLRNSACRPDVLHLMITRGGDICGPVCGSEQKARLFFTYLSGQNVFSASAKDLRTTCTAVWEVWELELGLDLCQKFDFTEMMRTLGYPRLISMENFRTPNFSLVAEIVIWLSKRFEPDAEMQIHSAYDTEQDRVMLIRSVAQFLAIKCGIKLNTRKLYQSDGYAIKEMLKITTVLCDALRNTASISKDGNDSNEIGSNAALDVASRIQDLKLTRELASHITGKGAVLYELLGKEVQLRETRNACVANQLEVGSIEKGLREAIVAAQDSVTNTRALIENIAGTEASLDAKIEKRHAELERNQKRLQTLKKVRPPFMEEFERLEIELRQLYQDYMARFRCVAFLEQQVEELDRIEQERIQQKQAATKRLLDQMREEEALRLLEENGVDLMTMDGDQLPPGDSGTGKLTGTMPTGRQVAGQDKPVVERIRTATNNNLGRPMTGRSVRRRVYGAMTAADEDSQSLDSDSDLLLDDDDDDELSQPFSDEDGLLMAGNASNANLPPDHSDDDF